MAAHVAPSAVGHAPAPPLVPSTKKEPLYTTTTLVPLRAQVPCRQLVTALRQYVAIYSKVFMQAGLVFAAVMHDCCMRPDAFPTLRKSGKHAQRIMTSCLHIGTYPTAGATIRRDIEPVVEAIWTKQFAPNGWQVSESPLSKGMTAW
jgi:hypothetical protein